MPSLAKVFLIGNLTRDPELRYTQSGAAVCDFSVAVNRRWRDSSGKEQEEVSFIDCQAWAKYAEIIGEQFKKGHTIFIEGRLKQDRWQDQSGQNRSRIRVIVERMQFLTRKNGSHAPHPQNDPQDGAKMDNEGVPF